MSVAFVHGTIEEECLGREIGVTQNRRGRPAARHPSSSSQNIHYSAEDARERRKIAPVFAILFTGRSRNGSRPCVFRL